MPKKILVVDDDKDMVEIYRRALEKAGYEPICAYTGEEGINILRANPVDLVVLDLEMPKMTGDEFLKIVRRDPLLKDTKILVMSSYMYRYREISRDRFVKEGFTKLAQRAEKIGKTEKEELQMEEKLEPKEEFHPALGRILEDEAEFERRVSEELVKRVKGIFGEPYSAELFKKKGYYVTVIEEKVKEMISKYFKIPKEKIYWRATEFKRDLGIAFVDAIDFRQKVEKEFGIKISFDDQLKINNVRDLIEYIEFEKKYERTRRARQAKELWKRAIKLILFICGVCLSLWLVIFVLGRIRK
ncbi:MAG: response regulator [Candidatus Omnitrophica bacterium]|nr:response regulator [Candidatus Omnitrophota bacterium]